MNTNQQQFLIVTTHPEFSDAAVAELKQLDQELTGINELAPGILLCDTTDVAELMLRTTRHRLTFARHLAPAQAIVNLANNAQDLEKIVVALAQLPQLSTLERGTRFAVQSRFVQTDKNLGERPFSTGQLNQAIAESLVEETGAIESIRKPQIVVSLLCTMHTGYLGISTAEENLSPWPGGARHFAQTSEMISRAEFKLLEAQEVFGVILPSEGNALDLGAAPGGWTRLLLEAGMSVIAVDPAHLDPRLATRKRLHHYQGYAEDFLGEAIERHVRFDIIVNDMRMDARDAARLLVQAASCLRPEGFIISVFKLPHETREINPVATLKGALNILSKRYEIVQARQLFHNRQEVTVVAARPFPAR